MKKYTQFLTVIFIIIPLLFLWGRSLLGGITEKSQYKLTGILVLILIALFTIGATWFLYRKEWRDILGLKTKGITKKVIWQAIGIGLLLGCISNIFIMQVYPLIFKEQPLSPFKVDNILVFSFFIFILAPLIEELLFRGFIQGLWQKLYKNKERNPVKLIIVITALLFAISHFGFLFNITVKQFLIIAIFIFIVALYMGWLRYKYQSIVPSICAHFGFNLSNVVIRVFLIIISLVLPDTSFHETRMQIELSQYENDTIPYNFDPNDMNEWERSYKKFAVLERPQSEEITKHLKGNNISLPVHFTIDTSGYIHSIYVFKSTDTICANKPWGKVRKYVAEDYYIQEYGYDFPEEVIKFIKSLPQCKPYIEDGKKIEKEMEEQVQFY